MSKAMDLHNNKVGFNYFETIAERYKEGLFNYSVRVNTSDNDISTYVHGMSIVVKTTEPEINAVNGSTLVRFQKFQRLGDTSRLKDKAEPHFQESRLINNIKNKNKCNFQNSNCSPASATHLKVLIMKNLLIVFVLFFTLMSCEEKFEKEKYDVQFTVRNTTDEVVKLNVDEISGKIKWEKSLSPGEVYDIKFNIKKDIDISEGGFIFKATFPDGESVEENSGYFTNYQIGKKNPQHYFITNEGIKDSEER